MMKLLMNKKDLFIKRKMEKQIHNVCHLVLSDVKRRSLSADDEN
jgi:hypothetical protein